MNIIVASEYTFFHCKVKLKVLSCSYIFRDSGHLHCSGAQQQYTGSNCAG